MYLQHCATSCYIVWIMNWWSDNPMISNVKFGTGHPEVDPISAPLLDTWPVALQSPPLEQSCPRGFVAALWRSARIKGFKPIGFRYQGWMNMRLSIWIDTVFVAVLFSNMFSFMGPAMGRKWVTQGPSNVPRERHGHGMLRPLTLPREW